MSKVVIHSGNHSIEVENDSADLSYVVEKAQKLFNETRPSVTPTGFLVNPAVGTVGSAEIGRAL